MKNLKIQKFREYLILEGDTPENFMINCLNKIKNKLDPLFDNSVKKMKDFDNFNLRLQNDSNIDKYSHTDTSLKYKFTDDQNTLYILTITIDLKDALNESPDEDYKTNDIKKAHVTFQKYADKNGSFTIVDQLMDRTVEPNEIDGDFLIKLKVELDEGKSRDENEEEFKIETNEKSDNIPEEETNKSKTAPNKPNAAQKIK